MLLAATCYIWQDKDSVDHTNQENLWLVGWSATARATQAPGESAKTTIIHVFESIFRPRDNFSRRCKFVCRNQLFFFLLLWGKITASTLSVGLSSLRRHRPLTTFNLVQTNTFLICRTTDKTWTWHKAGSDCSNDEANLAYVEKFNDKSSGIRIND